MNMRSRAPLLMALACAAAACERGTPGPASAAPAALATPAQIGGLIGPQPGPDQPVPRVRNPFEGDQAARVEGRRLFNWYNCAGCHGGHAGGGMGPSLRDSSWIYGSAPDEIFNSIAQGRAHGMPAWGVKLPPDQIWKLVAYIGSLGTQNEPSPPPPVPPEPPRSREGEG